MSENVVADLVEISLSQVPAYLQQGEYFQTLSENDDGLFSVPTNALKADPSIANVDDLKCFLRSLQYWIVVCTKDYKRSIITFLLSAGLGDNVHEVVEEHETAFPFLHVAWVALHVNKSMFIERNPLPLVQYVLDRHPVAIDILLHLSEPGHTHLAQCNNHVRDFLSSYTVEKVAECGELELLKILYSQDIRSIHLCYYAARGGQLACLQYLVGEGCELPQQVALVATTHGHVHILRYLHSVNPLLLNYSCASNAATGGHLACLRYLRDMGCPQLPCVAARAAEGGHLDCLRYAHEHEFPWGADTCAGAAAGGHLACLQYAREHGCPWDVTTCHSAVIFGSLACLEYAHTHGCPWDAYTCLIVATNGKLACLKYAHEHGCPWDESVTQAALTHFSCLAYALRNNCPYSPDLAYDAFTRGLNQNGFYILKHCPALDNAICSYAAEHGRLDILEACVQAGMPLHEETCVVALACGHTSCFEFAKAHGAPVPDENLSVTGLSIK